MTILISRRLQVPSFGLRTREIRPNVANRSGVPGRSQTDPPPGAGPLGNGFNETVLALALKGRKTTIKAALLDQKTLAGLGNIYVCEALFRAGLSPRRKAATSRVSGQRG